jgi:hypothetical protein
MLEARGKPREGIGPWGDLAGRAASSPSAPGGDDGGGSGGGGSGGTGGVIGLSPMRLSPVAASSPCYLVHLALCI